MIKVVCDFCGKPIDYTGDKITVTTEGEIQTFGCSADDEHHFHQECFTRLQNKVNQFIEEQKERR